MPDTDEDDRAEKHRQRIRNAGDGETRSHEQRGPDYKGFDASCAVRKPSGERVEQDRQSRENADEGSFKPLYGAHSASDYLALLQESYGTMADRFSALYPAATDDQRAQRTKEIMRDRGLASLWQWSLNRAKPGKSPVYGYLFSHVTPGPESRRYAAFHSSEITYALSTLEAAAERNFQQEDRDLSLIMSEYWLNFVKKGNPNGAGLPRWPQLESGSERIIEFGDKAEPRPLLPKAILDAQRDYIARGGVPKMF